MQTYEAENRVYIIARDGWRIRNETADSERLRNCLVDQQIQVEKRHIIWLTTSYVNNINTDSVCTIILILKRNSSKVYIIDAFDGLIKWER